MSAVYRVRVITTGKMSCYLQEYKAQGWTSCSCLTSILLKTDHCYPRRRTGAYPESIMNYRLFQVTQDIMALLIVTAPKTAAPISPLPGLATAPKTLQVVVSFRRVQAYPQQQTPRRMRFDRRGTRKTLRGSTKQL